MAKIEHLKFLFGGVKVWNEWRKNNPDIIPDLSYADLRISDLKQADFSKSELSGIGLRISDLKQADFSGSNLSMANFSGSNLSGADFIFAGPIGADFSGSNLIGADFRNANLLLANLKGAIIHSANFEQTNLTKCDFKDSNFYCNKISNCDLSQSIGLGSVKHNGPSSIGLDTILRSKGKIPISFLRGCGIPDDVIKTVLKLAKESAFGFYSCFISYSHKDEIFAEKLKKDLEANNVSCYFFPEDAVWGKDIEENIDLGIRDYDRLVVICSENSLNSEPVLKEIDRALQKEQSSKEKHKRTKRILFPVIIDDYFNKKWDHHLKPLMQRIVYGDFRDWKNTTKYKKALNRLLEGLKKD